MEAEVRCRPTVQVSVYDSASLIHIHRVSLPFDCPCSHKSSSIQKETPKKKPKLEMKPSNGDRYNKDCFVGKNDVSYLSIFKLFTLTHQ